MKPCRALAVAVLAVGLITPNALAQDTLSAVPTPVEVRAQTFATAQLDTVRNEFADEQERIRQLENQIALLTTAETAERARLEAERRAAEAAAAARERDLRIATLSGWAHSVGSLNTGLQSARGIASVANLTLIYRQGDATSLTGILDMVGKAAAVLGAAFSTSEDNEDSGLYIAAAGLSVTFVANAIQDYAAKNPELNTYVQRVAMHTSFAGEVEGLKHSLAEVMPLVAPLAQRADSLITANQHNPSGYATARVPRTLVNDYRRLIESYTILVSQLQHTNSLATRLLEGQLPGGTRYQWTEEIRTNLTDTQERTRDAIVAWRREIIVSEGQLRNLETLASLDGN